MRTPPDSAPVLRGRGEERRWDRLLTLAGAFIRVLVHSGDVHGGHYYAYVRPTTKTQWFKFDDERVTKARKKDVFKGNFGGDVTRTMRNALGKPITTTYPRSANAYMLLYIRDDGTPPPLRPLLVVLVTCLWCTTYLPPEDPARYAPHTHAHAP